MAAEQAMLLPVPYFHVVFTLPHALNPLMRVNRRLLYGLLFRVAAAHPARPSPTIPATSAPSPAITMVLHTWGQTLTEHYHVHCVVSGGGLSLDGRAWVCAAAGEEQPPPPVSVSRQGALQGLSRQVHRRPRARPPARQAALPRPERRASRSRPLGAASSPRSGSTDWVVYAKPPFGGPEQVLKYLSRYTHRVAISNRRLLFVGDGVVRFAYRDYADHSRTKEMTLPATEFLRRFLLHVVPQRLHAHPPLRHHRQLPPSAQARALPRAARAPRVPTHLRTDRIRRLGLNRLCGLHRGPLSPLRGAHARHRDHRPHGHTVRHVMKHHRPPIDAPHNRRLCADPHRCTQWATCGPPARSRLPPAPSRVPSGAALIRAHRCGPRRLQPLNYLLLAGHLR